jgi:hypothetical protein
VSSTAMNDPTSSTASTRHWLPARLSFLLRIQVGLAGRMPRSAGQRDGCEGDARGLYPALVRRSR